MYTPALLFCPADRPDRFGKAAAAADMVIIDLEDAVAPADKAAARMALRAAELDPDRTIVRVNPTATDDFVLDLAAVTETRFRTLMLAKAESVAQLDAMVEHDPQYRIIALCETPAGVVAAPQLASHPAVIALFWGAEDLIAGLGGRSSRHPDGSYREVARAARSAVLLAAGAAGKQAIDAVHLDIADHDGLAAEAADAAASGFTATACIHPSQVDIVRAAYAPTPAEREWAQRVLDEASRQPGVFRFEGRMVDEPILRHARRLLT